MVQQAFILGAALYLRIGKDHGTDLYVNSRADSGRAAQPAESPSLGEVDARGHPGFSFPSLPPSDNALLSGGSAVCQHESQNCRGRDLHTHWGWAWGSKNREDKTWGEEGAHNNVRGQGP